MDALFDSHTHLQLPEFDRDRDAVIERAREMGVVGMVAVGIDARGSRKALILAEKYEDVHAAVGYHPHDAKDVDDQALAQLKEMTAASGVVALGEIGLDYYRDLSPRNVQLRVFRRQLDLAVEVGLPVIIHSRNAPQETLAVVEEWLSDVGDAVLTLPHPLGVVHCFSGNVALAGRYLAMGFMISVAGNVTYPNAGVLREVAAAVPLDRLLIETDCPFLTPQVERGKRCEPRHVYETAKAVAELKRLPLGEVASATTHNARLLYRLAPE